MKSDKLVLVLVDDRGDVIRIFRHRKDAYQFPVESVQEMLHGEAVRYIRNMVWRRCQGFCELCGAKILKNTSHLHERHPRGKRKKGQLGEYSLENSVMVCPECHRNEHKEENWHPAKQRLDD